MWNGTQFGFRFGGARHRLVRTSTPTSSQSVVTVSATNAAGTGTQTLTITILRSAPALLTEAGNYLTTEDGFHLLL